MTVLTAETAAALAWIAGAAVAGIVVHRIVYALLGRWARRDDGALATAIVRRTDRPSAYILPLVCILAVVPYLTIPPAWSDGVEHATQVFTIAAFAWTVIALIRLAADLAIARQPIGEDVFRIARQFATRVAILSRTAIIIVVIVAFGAVLMTFPTIRAFGTTLLASAGVAGLVVGLAARPLFENLVAGVQLALTQPIRLDDAVVVEKQQGRIEQIHATYVVVRFRDARRMMLPLTYFINTPFENWSRRDDELVGEVLIFADYGIDIGALRAALPELVGRSGLWDGKIATVDIADFTDRAVQLRVSVSARGADELFDLRNAVREALLDYVNGERHTALPRARNETVTQPVPPPA
ncbi:hypothetical protein WPS_10790 [Vulcanimicrobium alpinum]|uniref:Mechanosensitive ion channel MscS domain-containing protein n=1 Tax=Vulcanimicrobium alpinum TaxID=3016050 RepID=A0AAN2C9B2_UNVUL|nr:mechanosensitive ion channel domain-containing protein [Vulcanimicrobium alpinum]BDE05803.1 hypothetical protein WPS_10790 [Vulcanimicrobium alpinum]